jgi:hypothetical protein
VSALHTAELMTPMLKPFGGLAAATDMDMVLDLAPLTAALEHICEFVQFPVDAATSEITSGSMPGVVDAAVAAAGGADALDEGVLFDDANTVTLIPRGAAGNIVQLRKDEVRLSVCDAEGRDVGTSTVAIRDDASVHMEFRLTYSDVTQPVLTVYVRSAGLKCWTSRRLVSDVLCHLLVWLYWLQLLFLLFLFVCTRRLFGMLLADICTRSQLLVAPSSEWSRRRTAATWLCHMPTSTSCACTASKLTAR